MERKQVSESLCIMWKADKATRFSMAYQRNKQDFQQQNIALYYGGSYK